MAAKCLAAIRFCRMRATRLNSDGTPHNSPNNVYVTDKPVSLSVSPVIEEGEDRTRVGGCDCIVASYRGKDKLKWFDFELELAVWEPALIELLTGATAIVDGGGDAIGFDWSDQAFNCSSDVQPAVVLEGWQAAQNQGAPDATYPWFHWTWPMTFWQIADYTLENDFAAPTLNGYSQPNSNWADGIFGDVPQAVGPLGQMFYAEDVPDASCDWQTQSIT